MGCCCSQLVPNAVYEDLHANYFAGLMMIHDTLRLGMETIIKHCDEGVPEDQRAGFLRYVHIFHDLVHAHHDHEEEIEFPAWEAKIPGFYEQELGEHKLLLDRMATIQRLCTGGGAGGTEAGAAGASGAASSSGGDVIAQIGVEMKAMQEFLLPHLKREEDKVPPEVTRKHFTEAEIKATKAKIIKASQAGPENHLVFIVYHLTPERRGVLELPGIVQSRLFPGWAAKDAAAWAFAPHVTKSANGKFSFA